MQRPKSVFSDNSAANHNREQVTKRVERSYEDYWQRRGPAVQKCPESSHGLDATDQAYRDSSQHFPAFAGKRNNTADEHRHREAPKIHSAVH